VRLRVEDAATVKRTTLNRIVDVSRPAHMPYQVELLIGEAPVEETEEPASMPPADDHAPGAVDLPGSEHIELAPQAPVTESEREAAADSPPEDSDPGA
jgi:hypothetical protein